MASGNFFYIICIACFSLSHVLVSSADAGTKVFDTSYVLGTSLLINNPIPDLDVSRCFTSQNDKAVENFKHDIINKGYFQC